MTSRSENLILTNMAGR